jgi:multiple sugar transport system substrate-binding protein
MRKMPLRQFLRLAGLAAVSAAAVRSIPATPALAQTPMTLRVMWWGSKSRHDRTIKVLEMYQAQNPGIKFTYEFAGFNDYWTRLATQAAGGNLPDIIQQDYARLAEWEANRLMMPLDDFVKDGTINLSRVPKVSVDGGRINGKLYAINLGNNSQSILLDLDAFKRAGVPLPDPKWTWQDFEQIALAIHQKLGIFGAGFELSDQQIWKSVYIGRGQWVFTPDGRSIAVTDDGPFVEHLKMLLRLQKAGAIPSLQQEISDFNSNIEAQPIVSGKAAISYQWSNQAVAEASAAGQGRHFKLVHLPRPKGGRPSNYLKPSQFFSITSHSKHPKEAAAVIDFFTNSVEANRVLLAERGVPIAPKVQEALKPILSPIELETVRYVARVQTDSSPLPPPDPQAFAVFYNNVFVPLVRDPVLLGKISPEEGAKVLRAEGNKVLSRPKS